MPRWLTPEEKAERAIANRRPRLSAEERERRRRREAEEIRARSPARTLHDTDAKARLREARAYSLECKRAFGVENRAAKQRWRKCRAALVAFNKTHGDARWLSPEMKERLAALRAACAGAKSNARLDAARAAWREAADAVARAGERVTGRPAHSRKHAQDSRGWFDSCQVAFSQVMKALPEERPTDMVDADRHPFVGLPKYAPMVGPGGHAEHINASFADRPILPAAGMGKAKA